MNRPDQQVTKQRKKRRVFINQLKYNDMKIILVEVYDNRTHDKIGEFKHKCYLNNAREINLNVEYIANRMNVNEYYFKTKDI